jgi:hypothetical protein
MIVVVLWKQISAFELCFMSGGVKVRLKPMDVAWLPHLPPQKSKIWGSSYLLAHKGNGTDFSHSHIQSSSRFFASSELLLIKRNSKTIEPW